MFANFNIVLFWFIQLRTTWRINNFHQVTITWFIPFFLSSLWNSWLSLCDWFIIKRWDIFTSNVIIPCLINLRFFKIFVFFKSIAVWLFNIVYTQLSHIDKSVLSLAYWLRSIRLFGSRFFIAKRLFKLIITWGNS